MFCYIIMDHNYIQRWNKWKRCRTIGIYINCKKFQNKKPPIMHRIRTSLLISNVPFSLTIFYFNLSNLNNKWVCVCTHVRRNNLITHITPHQGHTAVEPARMSVYAIEHLTSRTPDFIGRSWGSSVLNAPDCCFMLLIEGIRVSNLKMMCSTRDKRVHVNG